MNVSELLNKIDICTFNRKQICFLLLQKSRRSTLRISAKFHADVQRFSLWTDIFSHHRDIFANRNVQITFCNCRVFKIVWAFDCSTVFRAYFATGFSKENIRYPVWTCRDPISLILGTRFSMILGIWFSFLGTRIGSLNHPKKLLCHTERLFYWSECRFYTWKHNHMEHNAWNVYLFPHMLSKCDIIWKNGRVNRLHDDNKFFETFCIPKFQRVLSKPQYSKEFLKSFGTRWSLPT